MRDATYRRIRKQKADLQIRRFDVVEEFMKRWASALER